MICSVEDVGSGEARVCAHLAKHKKVLVGSTDGTVKLLSSDDLSLDRCLHSKSDSAVTCFREGAGNTYLLGRADGSVDGFKSDFDECYHYDGSNIEYTRNESHVLTLEHFDRNLYLVSHPWKIGLYRLSGERGFEQVQFHHTGQATWITHLRKVHPFVYLVTHGSVVSLWSFHTPSSLNQKSVCRLAQSSTRKQCHATVNGAFISSVDLLPTTGHVVYGKFDGQIRGVDMYTRRETFAFDAHRGRTWQVKALSAQLVMSCGEDGCMRLWDVRVDHNVMLIEPSDVQVAIFDLYATNYCVSVGTNLSGNATVQKWDLRLQ